MPGNGCVKQRSNNASGAARKKTLLNANAGRLAPEARVSPSASVPRAAPAPALPAAWRVAGSLVRGRSPHLPSSPPPFPPIVACPPPESRLNVAKDRETNTLSCDALQAGSTCTSTMVTHTRLLQVAMNHPSSKAMATRFPLDASSVQVSSFPSA